MKSFTGKLLIASPQLLDPNFAQAVLLLIQHDENGAMALVVNRPLDMKVCDAWEQVSVIRCAFEDPLRQGGPCQGPLIVVHTHEQVAQLSLPGGLHVSLDEESLEWLVRDGEHPIAFFLGYAGWSGGQLETEIEQGAWLVAEAERDTVFNPDEETWERLVRQLTSPVKLVNIDPRIMPEDPSLN